MKYRFLDITGPQIEAGVYAYCDWLDADNADAIANLVCEVHLAMCQACVEKKPGLFDQLRQKFAGRP